MSNKSWNKNALEYGKVQKTSEKDSWNKNALEYSNKINIVTDEKIKKDSLNTDKNIDQWNKNAMGYKERSNLSVKDQWNKNALAYKPS